MLQVSNPFLFAQSKDPEQMARDIEAGRTFAADLQEAHMQVLGLLAKKGLSGSATGAEIQDAVHEKLGEARREVTSNADANAIFERAFDKLFELGKKFKPVRSR